MTRTQIIIALVAAVFIAAPAPARAQAFAEAKAALVDHAALSKAQTNCDLISAESLLQDAFNTDVRPAIQEWRLSKGLPADPLKAFRDSGYMDRIVKERSARNMNNVSSYA